MPYLDTEKVDEKTRVKLEALIEKSYSSYWRKKRLFDIFFATLILIGFLPLMVIIAIVICIDDPTAGPFFKQKSVPDAKAHFFVIYLSKKGKGKPRRKGFTRYRLFHESSYELEAPLLAIQIVRRFPF